MKSMATVPGKNSNLSVLKVDLQTLYLRIENCPFFASIYLNSSNIFS